MTDTQTASEKIREYCRTHPEVFDETTEIHALAEGQVYRVQYDAVRDRVDVDHALTYDLVTCPECRSITEHHDSLTDCCGTVVPGSNL
jgi:hypothetical protein